MKLINVSIVVLPFFLASEVYSATVSVSKPTATVFSPTTTGLFASTNIPTTFLKPTRRQLGPVFPNPIVFNIPASATANVTCKAEAAFIQLAIFTFPGSTSVSFQGNGVNAPMTRVGSGSTAFINKPQPTGYQVQALFQFSEAQFPPFSFQDSEVREVNSSSTLITIGSEDSVDDDNNDTIARIEITPGPVVIPASQCTGSLQCCNSIQPANSSTVTTLLGLLGINPSTVSGNVGVNCSPITVTGVGGNSCSAQPACCTDTSFNGIIALGCNAADLTL